MGSQDAPNFILSSPTLADVDSMINVYEAAFTGDYFTTFTFPPTIDPSVKYQWLEARFNKMLTRPEIRHFMITDQSTGRMAAWVRWGFPHTFTEVEKAERQTEKEQKEREKKEGRSDYPEGAIVEVCDAKFGSLEKIRDMNVDYENTYVCYLLAVDPVYQRRGLGGMLLKHVLAMADAEGRKSFIEATPQGYGLYIKLGFQEIDHIAIDVSRWGGKEPALNRALSRCPRPLGHRREA